MTEILVKGPLWLTPPPPLLIPLKGTSFSLYYFFPLQGQVKVQEKKKKNCHSKWKFLIIGQHFCPISLPTPFTSILPLARLPFSAVRNPSHRCVLESGLGNGCCKTFHEQPLMNMCKPCRVLLHCPFTLLST